MKLATVTRVTFTDKSTAGHLDLDGIFNAYTLEPPTRADKPCAIPNGTYQVKLLWSDKFQMMTPHVLNVPGFTEIEWHPGNSPEDTDGCLLVGQTRELDWVGNSLVAFTKLLLLLPDDFEVAYVGTPDAT